MTSLPFREPAYPEAIGPIEAGNPYIGRLVVGSELLAGELKELCGPGDKIIGGSGGLVQSLMYSRALSDTPGDAQLAEYVVDSLRQRSDFGGVMPVTFERVDVRSQHRSNLCSVRVRVGGDAVRAQLERERIAVHRQFPIGLYKPSAVLTHWLRVAETTSQASAYTIAQRCSTLLVGATFRFAQPQVHRAPVQP